MVLKLIRLTLTATAVLAAMGLIGSSVSPVYAQVYGSPELFAQYYVPPAYGGVGAQLYPCPRPTQPWIGHVYITYPPLAPQEFLYQHEREYRVYRPDGTSTVTEVTWSGGHYSQSACHFFCGRNLPVKTGLLHPHLNGILLHDGGN
jgi:hypothetical protein